MAETLSADARRALGHLRGRSRSHPETGASCLFDWTEDRWQAALRELEAAGWEIRCLGHVHVADSVGLHVGYVLGGPERVEGGAS